MVAGERAARLALPLASAWLAEEGPWLTVAAEFRAAEARAGRFDDPEDPPDYHAPARSAALALAAVSPRSVHAAAEALAAAAAWANSQGPDLWVTDPYRAVTARAAIAATRVAAAEAAVAAGLPRPGSFQDVMDLSALTTTIMSACLVDDVFHDAELLVGTILREERRLPTYDEVFGEILAVAREIFSLASDKVMEKVRRPCTCGQGRWEDGHEWSGECG